jgi:hypothetical protein
LYHYFCLVFIYIKFPVNALVKKKNSLGFHPGQVEKCSVRAKVALQG